FFFQAEDGIRDWSVTGVQTCALPISCRPWSWRTIPSTSTSACRTGWPATRRRATCSASAIAESDWSKPEWTRGHGDAATAIGGGSGRAAWRGRREGAGGWGWREKEGE